MDRKRKFSEVTSSDEDYEIDWEAYLIDNAFGEGTCSDKDNELSKILTISITISVIVQLLQKKKNRTETRSPVALVVWIPEKLGDMSRSLTDKDLSRISQEIGGGWQHLGFELGISKVQMDHIREENEMVSMRITCMLAKWRNQNPSEATVKTLYNAMKNCSQLTFDKEKIERVFAGF